MLYLEHMCVVSSQYAIDRTNRLTLHENDININTHVRPLDARRALYASEIMRDNK